MDGSPTKLKSLKKGNYQVKGPSPKMVKTLIIVLYVLHVKVHVLSFNVIMISSA